MNLHELDARKNALMQLLAQSDYKALKAFEGSPNANWDEIKAERSEQRAEINAIEIKIKKLKDKGEEIYE